MDLPARRSAVSALCALAVATDRADRVAAGVALATFAECPEAEATLQRLLLDPEDTVVIEQTVLALLRRDDVVGLRLVARAYAVADDQASQWIHEAVYYELQLFEARLVPAMERAQAMLLDPDAVEDVRTGAAGLLGSHANGHAGIADTGGLDRFTAMRASAVRSLA